jgi:hypothetical protein
MESRNAIEEGVRLLARFEYSSASGFQSNSLDRGCDSTRAILRCLVTGDDSRGGQHRTRYVSVYVYASMSLSVSVYICVYC